MDLHSCSAAKVPLLVIAILISLAKDVAAANHGKETDRLFLLNFKLQVSDDAEGVLKSWNHSHHHCYWEGITCDIRHQRVISLSLPGKSLVGSISPYIGNLSFLKYINLEENRFNGEIPQEIGRLLRLRSLNLSDNILSGEIPVNLTPCSKLWFIRLSSNRLVGKIPTGIGSLKNLETLNFLRNNLTNAVPSSLGNLSSLLNLHLGENNLEGSLPNEIGFLRNLRRFAAFQNKLSGLFPSSIYNISTLEVFSLTQNFLEGELPNDIDTKMPNLRSLFIGGNHFYGDIPVSVVNATNLEMLELPYNKFKGRVPTNLGSLPKLQSLIVTGNLFGHNSIGDLNFITSLTNCSNLQILGFADNNFGGQLPQSIGNLSLQVEVMYMERNKISRTIPESLMKLENLYRLSMDRNLFTGTIPRDIGKLQSLQMLNLERNMLIGEVPSTFCNLTSLYEVKLSENNLEGTLPPCLGNVQSLKVLNISGNKLSGIISPAIFGHSFSLSDLDLSYNSFTGSLPPDVGKLANILSINISYNNFSGQIPAALGDCSNLQYLVMRGNSFEGIIPPKLASLKAIQYLDLSQNNLTGQIPNDLGMLPSLGYLNLSFNNLEGEVPRNGVFNNSSQIMLEGNSKLCGGIPQLQLRSCPIHRKKNWKLFFIVIVSFLFTLVLISSLLLYCYRRRYQGHDSSWKPSKEDKLLRISYHELQLATGGFSQENIVGTGSFGVVYKGHLDKFNGRLVAIKVLKNGVPKSFKAECNALRNIRHRNLVRILSSCSSIDFKGQDFMALVYDYMEKGSLDTWLHQKTYDGTRLRNLNFLQRMNIAIDVANALQYLHHHSGFVIAHCDLKPSNVLLDKDLTAHVGDFGLARLLSEASSVGGTSSSFAIKGTIGYAAPEYALGYEASTQGDVYSYGILLLEIFTGKRPTDKIFVNDLNLHNHVKNNLSERVEEILDPFLCLRQEMETRELESSEMICIISIFKIGLKCSEKSPNDRTDMNEVTRQLLCTRDAFIRGER